MSRDSGKKVAGKETWSQCNRRCRQAGSRPVHSIHGHSLWNSRQKGGNPAFICALRARAQHTANDDILDGLQITFQILKSRASALQSSKTYCQGIAHSWRDPSAQRPCSCKMLKCIRQQAGPLQWAERSGLWSA